MMQIWLIEAALEGAGLFFTTQWHPDLQVEELPEAA
jgi:hypothetical protein